jgi:hypothetical protein
MELEEISEGQLEDLFLDLEDAQQTEPEPAWVDAYEC